MIGNNNLGKKPTRHAFRAQTLQPNQISLAPLAYYSHDIDLQFSNLLYPANKNQTPPLHSLHSAQLPKIFKFANAQTSQIWYALPS